MKHKVRAKIYWIPEDAGGRKNPPTGPKYSTVARFDDNGGDWIKKAWSVVVENFEPPHEGFSTIADVSFLVSDAPEHLLCVGRRFELLEGRRTIGIVEVISEI